MYVSSVTHQVFCFWRTDFCNLLFQSSHLVIDHKRRVNSMSFLMRNNKPRGRFWGCHWQIIHRRDWHPLWHVDLFDWLFLPGRPPPVAPRLWWSTLGPSFCLWRPLWLGWNLVNFRFFGAKGHLVTSARVSGGRVGWTTATGSGQDWTVCCWA